MYSFDAAKALFLLAQHGSDGEMYCVANGCTRSLRDYINDIHAVCAPAIKPVFGAVPYAPRQVMHLGADILKLKKATGFEPDYSFRDGILEIKKWFIETNEEYIRDNRKYE